MLGLENFRGGTARRLNLAHRGEKQHYHSAIFDIRSGGWIMRLCYAVPWCVTAVALAAAAVDKRYK